MEDTLVSLYAGFRVAERAAEWVSLAEYHTSCCRSGEVPSYRGPCQVWWYHAALSKPYPKLTQIWVLSLTVTLKSGFLGERAGF